MINPILPCTTFIPDGELRVFGDRVYLYGSHDLYGGQALCEGDYEVWSAPLDDLGNWRNDGTSYRRLQDPYCRQMVESGKANRFNQYLYAPDVIEIDGIFYMYYGVGLAGGGFGVATATSPAGPFEYLGRVRFPDCEKSAGWRDTADGIVDGDMAFGGDRPMMQLNPFKRHFGIHMKDVLYDPGVLFDQGRLYLYYGVGYCYVVELDLRDKRTVLKNPLTGRYASDRLLPSSSVRQDKAKINAQQGWHMGNGSSIRKINDTYYLSYYAVNKDGCHALCYSTDRNPFGPFEFRGVLISLGNGDSPNMKGPTAYGGNTHGGLAEINGRWYQCYHRQTGDSKIGRQACLQEVVLQPDGSFFQAEFMSQVQATGGIQLINKWPAYMACHLTDRLGRTRKNSATPRFSVKPYADGIINEPSKPARYQMVTNLTEGCIVGFKYFDCRSIQAEAEVQVELVMRNTVSGSVDLCLDRPDQPVTTIMITHCQGVAAFTARFRVTPDIHAIYYVFHGQKSDSDFIEFSFC